MRPPFRSKQEVVIHAPLETVWAFNMDLRKIAEFHPRVWKVDLISGKAYREAGVAYRCHLTGGKHTCIEKDVEIVPMERIVTILPEDSFGISKVLTDYTVETSVQRLGDDATKVEVRHFYSTKSFKAWVLNLVARGKIARDTQAMLHAMKAAVEGGTSCAL